MDTKHIFNIFYSNKQVYGINQDINWSQTFSHWPEWILPLKEDQILEQNIPLRYMAWNIRSLGNTFRLGFDPKSKRKATANSQT